MVTITQSTIRAEVSDLNIAKSGWTTLFVDPSATTANDENDGFSWTEPKETIGGAMAAADNWCRVYVAAGTYAENVVIEDERVHLIGVQQDGTNKVQISPASGVPLTINAGFCEIEGLALVATDNHAIVAGYPYQNMHDLYIEVNSSGAATYYGIGLINADWCKISNCYFDGKESVDVIGILVGNDTANTEITKNYFTNWGHGLGLGVNNGYGIGVHANAQRAIVEENEFDSNANGVYFYVATAHGGHIVTHNSYYSTRLYDVDDNTASVTTQNLIRENFYGYTGWFEDYNGDGYADITVDCNLNDDLSPLTSPYAWKCVGPARRAII